MSVEIIPFQMPKPRNRYAVILSVIDAEGKVRSIRTILRAREGQIEAAAYEYASQLFPGHIRLTVTEAREIPVEAAAVAAADSIPPTNNMGGNGLDGLRSDDGTELLELVPKNGKAVFVRIPIEQGDVQRRAAFVDQISFTFHRSELFTVGNRAVPGANNVADFNEAEALEKLSDTLRYIFGFGITEQRHAGLNFYERTWFLGKHGLVSMGGQGNTILVQLYGSGCMAARRGWEPRLYRWLNLVNARITRVDLATDIFDGSYNPDSAEQDYVAGNFTINRKPSIERRGNWHEPDGRGRTLYIGRRESGKVLRVYEKGRQLGGGFVESRPDLENWTRIELELHNVDRRIPLKVLLRAGRYLAGAYPALSWLSKIQKRVETEKKSLILSVERAKAVFKHQFGHYLWCFNELFGWGLEAMDGVKDLLREKIPDRLDYGNYESCPLGVSGLSTPF